jgi:hypothetical protein
MFCSDRIDDTFSFKIREGIIKGLKEIIRLTYPLIITGISLFFLKKENFK